MKPYRYEDPFRPVYECVAVIAWLVAAAVAVVVAAYSPFPPRFVLLVAAFGVAMAGWRAWPAWRIAQSRRRLRGFPLEFQPIEHLVAKLKERPDAIWLGTGFAWSQEHAQLVHEIARSDEQKIVPRDDGNMGQPWIHGLSEQESDLWLPVDHNAGHLLLVGTTRSGKSRILDSLISQSICRGECTIVIDPKGDKDLCAAMQRTCELLGEPERFIYFHPAFPERSARIDPLKNFTRSTEIASRVASLIPSETGADPFSAFGQMAMNSVVQGLLMVNEKPSLVLLRRFIEGGPEQLLARAFAAHFNRRFPGWANAAKEYLQKAKMLEKRGAGYHAIVATAYIQFYRDHLTKVPGLASPELEGLIAQFEHDKTHYGKMVASLLPVLTMLTTGGLGKLLSPDNEEEDDTRLITDFRRIIEKRRVVYIGLDSLSDPFIGSAIGAMFLSDLAAVSGARYNSSEKLKPVNVYVDEAAECCRADPFIQLLNKGGGSLLRCTIATQTFADFAAQIGSQDKARMILGNLNNLITLRVLDGNTQKYICEKMPKVHVRHVERSQSTTANSNAPAVFTGSASERLTETEVEVIPPALLGCLPNLEFFGWVSGGRIIKGRTKIWTKEKPLVQAATRAVPVPTATVPPGSAANAEGVDRRAA